MRPTQTSVIGDITQDSPKTEDTDAQYRIQTSVFDEIIEYSLLVDWHRSGMDG